MRAANFRYIVHAAIVMAVASSTSPLVAAPVARYHHVHLTAPDSNAAVDWYVEHFGGKKSKVGIFVTANFGRVSLLFFQAKAGFPGSVGSSVDHIGFAYPDIHAKLKELEQGKVELVSGVEQEGPIKYAFLRDPWGTLIEVVEDAELTGFHHVHLATLDPLETLRWYSEAFGGEVSRYAGLIPGIRYGDMWLLAKKVKEQPAPTKGRSIDHLGWAFEDLDAAAVELKAKGVKFQSGPYAFGNGKIAFVEGPLGVRIELVGPASKP